MTGFSARRRCACAVAALFVLAAMAAHAETDRPWQTGTWTRVGVKRTPWVGDVVRERAPVGTNKPQMTEVATYVIETDARRYDLQSVVAIGGDGFDLRVTVGAPVTFAVEKKIAYVKVDGREYRLLVLKNEPKKTP